MQGPLKIETDNIRTRKCQKMAIDQGERRRKNVHLNDQFACEPGHLDPIGSRTHPLRHHCQGKKGDRKGVKEAVGTI